MKPNLLYQYQPLNHQVLRNLKKQIIYFNSPSNFNDPFDCSTIPNLKALTDKEVEEIRAHYLSKDDLPIQYRSVYSDLSATQLKRMVSKLTRTALLQQQSEFLSSRGVSCFSESPNELLMWSHYSDSCRGICLEYDANAKIFERALPVRYVDSPPEIDCVPLMMERDTPGFLNDLFCTKSRSWEYEKEWRVIHQDAGTEYTYQMHDLKSVYFGPNADRLDFEIVCLILQGQNDKVKFVKSNRSLNAFELIFEEYDYTSFINSKQD